MLGLRPGDSAESALPVDAPNEKQSLLHPYETWFIDFSSRSSLMFSIRNPAIRLIEYARENDRLTHLEQDMRSINPDALYNL
jgi:hypothetical protein